MKRYPCIRLDVNKAQGQTSLYRKEVWLQHGPACASSSGAAHLFLLGRKGEKPMFAQIYFHDPNEQVARRQEIFPDPRRCSTTRDSSSTGDLEPVLSSVQEYPRA